jgi:flagellar basal-body rod protein FlgB
MIHDLATAGAVPVLEAVLRFSAQRQRILAHNIANLTTPDFRPADVSTEGFARTLRDAVDRRRGQTGGEHGELDLRSTREVQVDPDGRMRLKPSTPGPNLLLHDRNNRDLERSMQDLVENVTVFRVASDLLRSRYALLNTAITERI